MSRRSGTYGKRRMGWRVWQTVLALAAACLFSAQASSEVQEAQNVQDSPAVIHDRSTHHLQRKGISLDELVKALTQGLDLDARQQSELTVLLQTQSEHVRRIWNDASIRAPYRISATQAISDQTADQIRALLNEEQRKKFNQPRPPHEASIGSTKPSVEDWMNAVRPK